MQKQLSREEIFQSLGIEVVAYCQRVAHNTQILFEKAVEMDLYPDCAIMTKENAPLVGIAVKYFDIGYAAEEKRLSYSGNVVCPQHTEEGARLLMQDIKSFKEFSALSQEEKLIRTIAKDVACFHHERWDGQGFPDGLKKEEIPLLARMCAICFEYECLTNSLVKKHYLSNEDAVEQIEYESGKKFDPDLVNLFKTMADLFVTCTSEQKKEPQKAKEKIVPKTKGLEIVKTENTQRAIEVKYQEVKDFAENSCEHWQAEVVINDNFYGTFSSVEYFSIAERSGQIVKITDVALEQVMQSLYVCKKSVVSKIAIRISGVCLLAPNFLAKVEKNIKYFEIEEGRLQFDVALADVATSDSKVVGVLEKLRSLGIKIAICEFGSHYQTQRNFDYLTFDYLKVDDYLAQEMINNEQIKNAVKDIVALAEKYQVETICAGVETQEQVDALLDLGCLKMYGKITGNQINQRELMDLQNDQEKNNVYQRRR